MLLITKCMNFKMDYMCSCRRNFMDINSFQRHQIYNPNHKKSVEKSVNLRDSISDDENIDNREDQALDAISWQQLDVHSTNSSEAIMDFEYPIQHPDHFGGRSDSITYTSKQLNLYERIYGIRAFHSSNIEEFVMHCKNVVQSGVDINQMKVMEYCLKHKLSRSAKDDMLQLIRTINPNSKLPVSWKTFERKNAESTSDFKYLEIKIPYPEEWQLNKWTYPVPLEDIIIFVRDPIEIISLQLVDPVLQFMWSDHISYIAFIKRNDNN